MSNHLNNGVYPSYNEEPCYIYPASNTKFVDDNYASEEDLSDVESYCSEIYHAFYSDDDEESQPIENFSDATSACSKTYDTKSTSEEEKSLKYNDEVTHSFYLSDAVEVIEEGLQGRIISMKDSMVTIKPKEKDLMTFHANELRRNFKQGDYVKVVSGSYKGETGLITHVGDDHVVMFSNLTMQEWDVLPNDLQFG